MADCKASIVMPVYNSESYVANAARSVLAQDFDGFELLLIDDGSTDGSGGLCDEIAARDDRVRVIHQENGGMCQARNVGMAQARGEYISFCDNDDVMLPGFIADNYALAEKHDADVVRFGRTLRRISSTGETIREIIDQPPETAAYQAVDIAEHLDAFFFGSVGVWTGLYRKSMLEQGNMLFDTRLRNGLEDDLFNSQVYGIAHTVAFNSGTYYIWQRRESHSASMSASENRLLGLRLVLQADDSLFTQYGLYDANPRFCAQRLMLHAKDLLTSGHYQADISRTRQYALYDSIRKIYEPYRGKICASRIEFQYAVMRDCLLNLRYGALFEFIRAGVAFKKRFGSNS